MKDKKDKEEIVQLKKKKKHRILHAAVFLVKKFSKTKLAKKKLLGEHTVAEIGSGAYRITEAMIHNSYLFVGSNEALLIDTGIGISGLLDAVKGITNKPLTVVATHSHPFAVGGAGEFDKVLIDKRDYKDAQRYNRYKLRKWIFKIIPTTYFLNISPDALIEAPGTFEKIPKKQTEFDLGGRTISIIRTPSHTKGSCCFEDSETKIVVTGHVTTPLSLMITPHSTTMAVYASSMNNLITHLSTGVNYASYWYKPLSYEHSYDLKDLTDEAVAYGNDYTKILRLRFSDDKKRAVLYFPAKTIRRKLKDRLYMLRY